MSKKMADFQKMQDTQLLAKFKELNKDLQSFLLQKATGQLGQSHLLRVTRRDIARVKTLLRKRQFSHESK